MVVRMPVPRFLSHDLFRYFSLIDIVQGLSGEKLFESNPVIYQPHIKKKASELFVAFQ